MYRPVQRHINAQEPLSHSPATDTTDRLSENYRQHFYVIHLSSDFMAIYIAEAGRAKPTYC